MIITEKTILIFWWSFHLKKLTLCKGVELDKSVGSERNTQAVWVNSVGSYYLHVNSLISIGLLLTFTLYPAMYKDFSGKVCKVERNYSFESTNEA